jgi:hypothetical protein
MMNLMEVRDGQPRGSMVLGASVNYSPEFTATEANAHLLRSLAEAGGGQVLDTDPTQRGANPFLRDRRKTFQPVDLHLWLMKFAVLLFLLDVGVRRIQLDREELVRATATLRRWLLPWEGRTRTVEADESLNTLLTRRDEVRARHTAPVTTPLPSPELFRPKTPPASSPTDKPLSAIPPATAVSTPADAPASAASPSAENTMASRLLAARKKEKK